MQYWPQGASLGLASGITGGAAAITKKVLNSQQMKKVEVAIEVGTITHPGTIGSPGKNLLKPPQQLR